MAFPSVFECLRDSQTELFNSGRQRRFRPCLLGKSTYTITASSWASPRCLDTGSSCRSSCLHSWILHRRPFRFYSSCHIWYLWPFVSCSCIHSFVSRHVYRRTRTIRIPNVTFPVLLHSQQPATLAFLYAAAPLWRIQIWEARSTSELEWLICRRKKKRIVLCESFTRQWTGTGYLFL